eukprot:12254532-Heterocapsa_arctica.AAC.1
MGAKTHESGGERYHAAHKASTENRLAPGWAARRDVGGFKPLRRVHASVALNSGNILRVHAKHARMTAGATTSRK